MLELWIDGRKCDIEHLPTLPIDFELSRLRRVDGYRTGRTIELELPSTPCNDAIFGSSRDLYATTRFNSQHHKAEIWRNGVMLFGGTAYLRSTTIKEGWNGAYVVAIAEGGAEWIERCAKQSISDLEIPFDERLSLNAIAKSWSEEKAVRFLPIHRGDKQPRFTGSSSIAVERVMLSDDYHPFISVAEMVKAMFKDSGYTLRSNFFDSEFGRSLYMSGDYTRSDASQAKSKCDFFARRSSPTTAKANYLGRVYASTAFATNTVGPIVDTANPEAFDSEGVQMVECFNTLNAFSKNSAGNICFAPKSSVKAGFMLHLEYETDYAIVSRDSFVGFDTVEGLDGVRVDFPLANTCTDHRSAPKSNWQYRALVFDHISGNEYKLVANCNGQTSSVAQWSTRSQLVVTPNNTTSLQLLYRNGTPTWTEYRGDWALYAGYIEEQGKMNVEMDLRIPPQEVGAGEEFVLDKIWFGGAEQGMAITIGIGTTLRPYFTTVPGYGSHLEFADIAPRQLRQIDLLTALGEMFNLGFFTDRERNEVYIEPLDNLYEEATIELESRIDCTQGVDVADCGLGQAQELSLEYLATDRATHAFNLENGETFGQLVLRNPLYGTKDSQLTLGNKLFTTTLNTTNIVASAPSASIPRVGDIGGEEEGIDNPFTLRILCYKGLQPLPEGECWIAENKQSNYPYATFCDGKGTNLCYEDRDGEKGLHRYYDEWFARQCESQRVTLDLHLTTAEIASLLTKEGSKPSVLHRFRFKIEGESALFRLVEVGSWNSESNIVRCTFERELND